MVEEPRCMFTKDSDQTTEKDVVSEVRGDPVGVLGS